MKSHLDKVREQPCCVCGLSPVSAHHALGGSVFVRIGPRGRRKHSDFLALPLCYAHHQGAKGVHTLGVATWEAKYGRQSHFIDQLCHKFNMDLWRKAREEVEQKKAAKKYKPSSKTIPRRFT